MTYTDIQQKIFTLLGVDASDQDNGSAYAVIVPVLPYTVDSVLRKTVLYLKNYVRTEDFYFVKGTVGVQTTLPDAAFAVRSIEKNGKVYGSESFMMLGRELIFFEAQEGSFTVSYDAFPPSFADHMQKDLVFPLDDYTADLLAYGAAGELCHLLYPSDLTKYMRLMTEYDERMAAVSLRSGDTAVKNTLFGGKGRFS